MYVYFMICDIFFIFVYIFYDTKIYIKKEEEYMLLMELEAK